MEDNNEINTGEYQVKNRNSFIPQNWFFCNIFTGIWWLWNY